MINRVLLLLTGLLFTTHLIAADGDEIEGCVGINGSKAYTIAFSVTGDSQGQSLWIQTDTVNNANEIAYIWIAADDDSYVFEEPALVDQQTYDVTITFSGGGNGFYTYYLDGVSQGTGQDKATGNGFGVQTNTSEISSSVKCYEGTIEPQAPSGYVISLTPSYQYALQCENPNVTVTVTNNGVVASGVDVSITYSPSDVDADSSDDNIEITDSSGQISVPLNANVDLGEYWITAAIEGSSESDLGKISIVPFKFSADNQYMTAGSSQQFNLEVLACENDTANIVSSYNEQDISYTSSLVSPSSGSLGTVTLANQSGGTPIDFASGIAAVELNYNESGEVLIELSDPNFNCTGVSGCPIDGSEELKGSFTVYSRPWTFAVCDSTDTTLAMDGDISSSAGGYKAAGEEFSLKIYPIIWQDNSASTTDGIDVSTYCDEAQDNANVTNNFFYDSAAPSLSITSKVSQPSSGADGTLSVTASTDSSSNEYFLASGLSWSEVGVLRVMVDADGDYLDMDINQSYRDIGRFYPNHLELVSNSWTYATNHSGFAYMDQPIGHNFTVRAMNSGGSPVANYKYFSSDLVADIAYYAMSGTTSLEDRLLDGSNSIGTWTSADDWSLIDSDPDYAQLGVTFTDFTFVKNAVSSSPYETEPDGPYYSGFGVQIVTDSEGNTPDDISFNSDRTDSAILSALFTSQPDFRYGRMTLTDVGGNSDSQITVPLKVEYWSDGEFITNTDDSGSAFDNGYYCRQVIWSDASSASSDASFSVTTEVSGQDEMKVYDGEYGNLIATHTGENREQVRLWLRQQSTEPTSGFDCYNLSGTVDQPWLRYNWRDSGDEDPSAVVVFGTYRGNDRVIFRGESRLTGQ